MRLSSIWTGLTGWRDVSKWGLWRRLRSTTEPSGTQRITKVDIWSKMSKFKSYKFYYFIMEKFEKVNRFSPEYYLYPEEMKLKEEEFLR